MPDQLAARVATLADLTVREREIALFETGEMMMLDGKPITREMIGQWREEVRELRRRLFPPP
jgi:hypothetical protein